MRYIVITLLLWQMCVAALHAQETVQGVVVSENSKGKLEPISFANVYWLGTNYGTTTDTTGVFRLAVPENASKLVVSFIGYRADTTVVRNYDDPISISLNKVENTLGTVEVEYRRKASEMSFINPIQTINMNEKELYKAACCNLSESFETNPSVDVNFTDAVTGTRQIRMLGLVGPYTMISRENMPGIRGLGNAFGLSFIPGHWVKSIQVTKGVGSVVNGYESIAGQINIEMQKPDLGPETSANIFLNGAGRTEANFCHSQKISQYLSTAVLLHGSARPFERDVNEDGFRDFPLQNQINFINRWKFNTNVGWMGQLGVHFLKDDKIGGQTDEVLDRPFVGLIRPSIYRINIESESAELFGKLGYVFSGFKYKSMGFQWSLKRQDQNSNFGNRDYDVLHQSAYVNWIYQSIIGNTNHQFKTGASFQFDEYDEQFELNQFDRSESIPGAFFEYTFKPSNNFTLVSGIRGDYHNLYGAFLTPRVHLRYAVNENTVIRGLAGSGQRSPTVLIDRQSLMASSRNFEFLGDNPDGVYGLDMEKAWNVGFNLTKSFTLDYREGVIQVDFYRTVFENQVVVDVEDRTKVSFYNLDGTSFSNAAQVQIDYELLKFLDLRAAYRWVEVKTTYNTSVVSGESSSSVLEQPYIPEHRFFVNIGYETRKSVTYSNWAFDFTNQWFSKQRIPSTLGNTINNQRRSSSPSFMLLNTQITRNFNKQWAAYLGVENVLNYRQDNPIIDADNPFGEEFDASMVWAPIFGRNIYFGIRWTLKDKKE